MLLETRAGKGFKKLDSSFVLPEFGSLLQNFPHTDQTCCFLLSILQLGKIHQEKSLTPFRYSTQLSSCLSVAHRTTASSPEKWDNCHCITQPSLLPSRHTASRGFSPKKKIRLLKVKRCAFRC